MKVGDWVVFRGRVNFWPGQIIGIANDGLEGFKVLWNHKSDWSRHYSAALEKIPPLKLLAMQAQE